VLDALHALMQGRIALIITHRLHTVGNVDRVVMLDGGGVIADSTHKQLLAQSATYCELVSAYERGTTT